MNKELHNMTRAELLQLMPGIVDKGLSFQQLALIYLNEGSKCSVR